ncbi:hypothetical protein EYF80_032110 [Liparis tanakae]|uniref:Uncharacterized protein n=1 Tax=Liparis tanakae TaxID=230148 RepID=A0A4Z2GVQ1_9TELE|nr:hypothetical protein EYF80_032110 [Liparis tanakae]
MEEIDDEMRRHREGVVEERKGEGETAFWRPTSIHYLIKLCPQHPVNSACLHCTPADGNTWTDS